MTRIEELEAEDRELLKQIGDINERRTEIAGELADISLDNDTLTFADGVEVPDKTEEELLANGAEPEELNQ